MTYTYTFPSLGIIQFEFASYTFDDRTDFITLHSDMPTAIHTGNTSDWAFLMNLVNNNEITIRPWKPGDFHSYDEVNNVWIFDMGLFTPYLSERVSQHRDLNLEGTVEFTFDSTTFRLQKNVRTVSAITAYHADIPVENDENYSVDYLTYTDAEEPELWVVLNGSEIQEVFNTLTKKMKDVFSAHKFVTVTTHNSTPYIPDFDNGETIEDCIQRALSDFDTHLANL